MDVAMADDAKRGHVPYGLLLVRAAADWRAEHAGSLPATPADRQAFKDRLRTWNREVQGVPIEVRALEPAAGALGLGRGCRHWGPCRRALAKALLLCLCRRRTSPKRSATPTVFGRGPVTPVRRVVVVGKEEHVLDGDEALWSSWRRACSSPGSHARPGKHGLSTARPRGLISATKSLARLPHETDHFSIPHERRAAPELLRLFEDPECMELHAGSKPFWICVAALRRFVEQESSGCIPLEVGPEGCQGGGEREPCGGF